MEWIVLIGKTVAWILTAVALLAAVGFAYELISERRDERTQPGELVSVSGRAVHVLCRGEPSNPAVILEAGGGRSSTSLREIQLKLAEFARVCIYDRAGFGFSDPVDQGRTFDEITADLDALLVRAQVAPPYILVGHSMGGLMVRNYFRHHPENVAGVVLLDAAEEEHNFTRLEALRDAQSNTRTNVWLARFGIIRLLMTLAPEKAGIPSNIGPELRKEIVKEHSRPEFFRSVAYELEAYFSATQEMRKSGGFGSLGSTPLVVVTHGKPLSESQPFYNGWTEAQSRLAALSTDSKIVVAEQSGHDISLDQPELVVELVRSLIGKTAPTYDEYRSDQSD